MDNNIEFAFPSERLAYRFLNTVRHFEAEALKVRYGRNNHHVAVSYRYKVGEFDATLSQLDDLARELQGEEVS